MKALAWFQILLLTASPSGLLACMVSRAEPFENVAPRAGLESVRGWLEIEDNLKGALARRLPVAYSLNWCGRVQLNVGHIYPMATPTTLEGLSADRTDISIADISETDLYAPLDKNQFAARARRALQGMIPYSKALKDLPNSGIGGVPPRIVEIPVPAPPNKHMQRSGLP
jgi:hypothetical protein